VIFGQQTVYCKMMIWFNRGSNPGPRKQRSIANLRFLFPYLATTQRILWVFAKVEHVRLDCEYRRPSPNFAEWVQTMFPYQYALQTQACCEACEPCDLLWKLTLRFKIPSKHILRQIIENGEVSCAKISPAQQNPIELINWLNSCWAL